MNIGGEYPVWSNDRGQEWDTFIPGVIPTKLVGHLFRLTQGKKDWVKAHSSSNKWGLDIHVLVPLCWRRSKT